MLNVSESEKIKILENLKKKFIGNREIKSNPMWNLFNIKAKNISYEKAKKLNIPNSEDVFFYIERKRELYKTTYDNACKYIDNVDEGQWFDGYVFDNTYEWILAVTHEDKITLTIGI